jgi:hypothetical protein
MIPPRGFPQHSRRSQMKTIKLQFLILMLVAGAALDASAAR